MGNISEGTATIPLERYEQLLQYEKAFNDNRVALYSTGCGYRNVLSFISKDDAYAKLIEANRELRVNSEQEFRSLIKEINELKAKKKRWWRK